ncbi:MAG: DEAD/DEAH box helicase [Pseudomonadales bacterium]|jgi:ATP-dependent RNA helicase RhlE|nr:DEAD/DEAH box helicase [Pseudomonadales bacterium]
MSAFQDLGLRAELVRAVSEQGYTTPTPVQTAAIPPVLEGRDLMAAAQTGTGKTAGFTLPLLQRLVETPVDGPRRVRALVLVPTRELAAQVAESVRVYGAHLPLRCALVFGGVGLNPQIAELKRAPEILVATPGRLLDLAARRAVDLSRIEVLVLDEADRMLDMGFIHDIRKVLALLPKRRQNLLFSATFADEIRNLAEGLLDRPVQVEVARRNATADTVAQRFVEVDAGRKPELLIHLLEENGWDPVLVFTRTKHGANRLAQKLVKAGVEAEAIHGNKSQNARTRALEGFKDGRVRVLVATDIAARGLDIDGLPQVVNFELPNVPEDYVHRIGRTGRAGATGSALSLVSADERKLVRGIERVLKRQLPLERLDGFVPTGRPAPVEDDRPPRGARPPQGRGRGAPSGNRDPRGGQGNRQGQGRSAQGSSARASSASAGGTGAPRRRRRRGGAGRAAA